MQIKAVRFLTSNTDWQKLPPAGKPEFAFVGRSNVGKSSLINCIIRRKDLAHVSSTPGKTQTINHFMVNENWYLADLPGYGYAKVGKTLRAEFGKMVSEYVTNRTNLVCLMVLIDLRLPPQALDLEFMQFLGVNGVPFAMVYTKADKVKRGEREKNLRDMKSKMLEIWEELPPQIITSAETDEGRETLLKFMSESMQRWIKGLKEEED